MMADVCGRFLFAADMNGDEMTTISEVFLWLKGAFLLPSNFAGHVLMRDPHIGKFFELDCGTGNGIGGGLLSLIAWILLLAALTEVINDLRGK